MSSKIVWPRDTGNQEALMAFYGPPGGAQVRCELPYEMRLDWDPGKTLRSFFCHRKCEPVFRELFRSTLSHYGADGVTELGLDRFGGCLNVRRKTGGKSWSVHAWGAAIDLWPSKNQFRWKRDRAVFAGPEYVAFWELVEGLGLVSLGRTRDFDWMHFQAAKF